MHVQLSCLLFAQFSIQFIIQYRSYLIHRRTIFRLFGRTFYTHIHITILGIRHIYIMYYYYIVVRKYAHDWYPRAYMFAYCSYTQRER